MATNTKRWDATEDIALDTRATIIESSIGRIAILICEDAARIAEFAPVLRAVGVSLLLVPVFSKELRQHHWEDSAAKAYADGMGCGVVVCNSLGVTNARRRGEVSDGAEEFVDDSRWGTRFLAAPTSCSDAATLRPQGRQSNLS